jgi:nicotinate-nucleotide adenylyltransferase
MNVGLLGGTFDPLHNGHLKLAKAALKQEKLACVYLVLSPKSPFKINQALSPVPLRKKWLQAGLKSQHRLHMGSWELNRKGPSYTLKTLQKIKKLHPKWNLFFILGSDAFSGFSKWKNPVGIVKLASLLVGRRPHHKLKPVLNRWAPRVRILKGVFPDVSSSEIRSLLKTNPKAVKKLVPKSVFEKLI